MRKAIIPAFLLLLGSTVLGATVLREPLANAASSMSVLVTNSKNSPIPVAEQNLDANGNIKVHEQGTANVNVTNNGLAVHEALPATLFSTMAAGTQVLVSGPDPSGTKYAISSLTASTPTSSSPGFALLTINSGTTSDCQSFTGSPPDTTEGPELHVPTADDTRTVSFPLPYVFSAPAATGRSDCLFLQASTTTLGTVVGYKP